jgi:acetyl-CoA carboxylase carboxyl transferase subunit beta
MLKDFFNKKPKYVTVKTNNKKGKNNKQKDSKKKETMDNKLWTKCPDCKEIIFNKKLVANLMVCPFCDYHMRLSARDRLQITVDDNSFSEFASELKSGNPLDFPGYKKKLDKLQNKTGINDAIITGEATIGDRSIVIAVMDFNFMGASMGSVVGEKITIAIEKAIEKQKPLIIFNAAGGARMQEGMLSLMQMAKTSAAVKKLDQENILYISVFTDPTSGGVTASFASLGDIILAEPDSLIAFAGPRVIKQTINAQLPEGFQRAEFLLEHGMIDKVVPREELRKTLSNILKIHQVGVRKNG